MILKLKLKMIRKLRIFLEADADMNLKLKMILRILGGILFGFFIRIKRRKVAFIRKWFGWFN